MTELFLLVSFVLGILFAFPLALVAFLLVLSTRGQIRNLRRETEALKRRLSAERPSPTVTPEPNPEATLPPTPIPSPQSPKPLEQPVPTPVIPSAPTPVTPSAPTPVTPPTPTPVIPSAPTPVPPSTPTPSKPNKNLENVFGKNILGLAATALVFIGLVAFGVLALSVISDEIKILGLFLASFAITGAGIFLTRKNRNAFTETLMGCGVGAVYISILVTHLYFGKIGDLVAFALILLWGVGVYLLSRLLSARSLVYLAHFGCILSTVLSVCYGQVTGKYIEITVYQIVTFVLLFFANRKHRTLYLISSYASILLNIILAHILVAQVGSDCYGDATAGILGILCLALTGFNTAISLLLLKRNPIPVKANRILTNVTYFLALFLGGYLPAFAVFEQIPWQITTAYGDVSAEWTHAMINGGVLLSMALILALAGALLTLLTKDRTTHWVSFLFAEGFFALILFVFATPLGMADFTKTLPLTVLFAVTNGLLAIRQQAKGNGNIARALRCSGFVFLLTDAFLSAFFLPQFEAVGILYSLGLLALSFWFCKTLLGSVWGFPTLQILLIDLHLIFTASAFGEEILGDHRFGMLFATAANIVLYLAYRFGAKSPPTQMQKTSDIFTEILHSLWVFLLSLIVAGGQSPIVGPMDGKDGYHLAISALILLLALLKAPDVIRSKHPFMSVWYAIKFTYLVLLPIGQFTELFDESFILSLFLMGIAGLCIVFGFFKDLKSTRIYGLLLILFSVLKMVIADVWNQESLVRVVSLIAGGIICFAISAIYSYAEKRQMRKGSPETKPSIQ